MHFKDGTTDRMDTADPDSAAVAITVWRLDPRTIKITRQVENLPLEVVYTA